MDPIFNISELADTLRRLQDLDYYQILKIDASASKEAVRMAYFRESKVYHPDRFFRQVSDQDLRIINDIYKTIAEAYRVLSDSTRRRQYDKGLATDRSRFLRYDPSQMEDIQPASEKKRVFTEAIAVSPMAKKYVREALNLMKRKAWAQAEVQIKLALGMESDNADIRALAEEIATQKKFGGKPVPGAK